MGTISTIEPTKRETLQECRMHVSTIVCAPVVYALRYTRGCVDQLRLVRSLSGRQWLLTQAASAITRPCVPLHVHLHLHARSSASHRDPAPPVFRERGHHPSILSRPVSVRLSVPLVGAPIRGGSRRLTRASVPCGGQQSDTRATPPPNPCASSVTPRLRVMRRPTSRGLRLARCARRIGGRS